MELINVLLTRRSDKIKLSDSYKEYIEFLGIINACNHLPEDFNQIEFLKSKINLLNKIIPNINMLIQTIERLQTAPISIDTLKKDIEKISEKFKEEVTSYIANDSSLSKLQAEIDKNEKIKDIVKNEDYKDNAELLLDYIKESFYQKMLSIDEAVNLNMFIAQKSISIPKEKDVKPANLLENEESILNSLAKIFKKHGYVFEELEKEVIDKFNKFADLEYVDFVLDAFEKCKLTQNQLLSVQKRVYDIITFKDENTFNKMMKFIDENDCSLVPILMWFPGSFRAEAVKTPTSTTPTKYTKNNSETSSEDEYAIIEGNYDRFIKNCEILKRILGKDKLNNSDFARRETFINTNTDLIIKNLKILREYKIIGENDYPDTVSALIGNYTTYHLDRFIETGNYEYITKNLSYLSTPKNPLRFYKLRRAADLGEEITRGRGIRSEIMQNQYEYKGILENDENGEKRIVQRTIIERDRGIHLFDRVPEYNLRPYTSSLANSESIKKAIYSFNYYYRMYDSFKAFGIDEDSMLDAKNKNINADEVFNLPKDERDANLANIIQKVFNAESEDEIFIDPEVLEDGIVKHLDSRFQTIDNHSYDIKKDEFTYEFRFTELTSNEVNNDNLIIKISRYKVLRTITLLKKYNLWIDQRDYSYDEMIKLITAILIRDSIIVKGEFLQISRSVKYFFKNYLQNYINEKTINDGRGGYYA